MTDTDDTRPFKRVIPPPTKEAESAWLRYWWFLNEGETATRWVRVLRALALWAPFGRKVINERGSSRPYLLRVYLTPVRIKLWQKIAKRVPWFGRVPEFYLHYFFRGDNAAEVHNHPFCFSLSLILTAGYLEARKVGDALKWHHRAPGDVVGISRKTFHQVQLKERTHPWTLFFTGVRVGLPRAESWGFKDPLTSQYTHHEAYKKGRSK